MKLGNGLAAVVVAGMMFGPVAANAQQCVRLLEGSSSGEKLSMDPLDNLSHEDIMYLTGIYEPLVELNTKFEPVPVLAERWEASADAKTWTFHLRHGVKFHNGKELDAEDVVFSFKRLIDPAMGSGAAATLAFLDPAGISAVDKYTVRFVTKASAAEFPTLIRNKFTVIVPAGSKREDLRKKGIGTGPFLQESFTLGAPYNELKRNPNYWRAGLPKAPCIRIMPVPDPTARTAALSTGQADVMPFVDVATVSALKASPSVRIMRADGGTYYSLAMWVDTPPFNDVRVRTAMKLVVDRKSMVDLLLLGEGIAGNDSPMPPNSPWAYMADVPKPDIARAKALLAEAGHPNGITIDLNVADRAFNINLGQVYAAMAAQAGIKVNVIKNPAASYYSEVAYKKPFKYNAWAARPPQEALSIAYRKSSTWNDTHWFRDDYDALLDQAAAAIDLNERRALYQKAQKLLAEEGGLIIAFFEPMATAMRTACTGYQPHPSTNIMDFTNIVCSN